MRPHFFYLRALIGITLMGLLAPVAFGVITAPSSLTAYSNDSPYIFVAKVEKLLPAKPAMILTVAEDLKGKSPYRRLPINLTGDSEATKENHVPQLLKRLAVDQSVVMFIVNERGKKATAFVFTNGTWFQVIGTQTGARGEAVWSLTHGEPYLRRTFKGTTDELIKLLRDSDGKTKLPEPNAKEPPGFGPEATPARTGYAVQRGPLFGVIPTLGVGAPLAILALLFPALFGGVFGLFRQWSAFLTILSINSTLLLLRSLFVWLADHGWLGTASLRSVWLGWLYDDATLWLLMTAVVAAGVLWSWRRHLSALSFEGGGVDVERKTELTVLLTLSATCLVVVAGMAFFMRPDLSDLTWDLTLALALGIGAATLYRLVRPSGGLHLPLATEGVMLGVALLTHIAIAGHWSGAEAVAPVALANTEGTAVQAGPGVPEFKGQRWVFQPKDSGIFVSSALVTPDRVYAAAAHPTFKGGTLFCLDRATGKEVWNFIDDGDLKEMISSPTLADGRIYLGEGFHDDPNCKLYCLDAATGKKLWEYQTTSQTESSPQVEGGKVYSGVGNDGFVCLDAVTGTKVWQHRAAKGIQRFGAAPAIAEGRVYAATGVDRNHPDDPGETAVFCFDAASGKVVWKTPTTLPCWGKPVVQGGRLYLGLGNGDIFTDAAAPAGQVLCLDAATGQEIWKRALPNGVLEVPALDAMRVYVGCRDGNVYALDLRDGTERWKTALGSAIVAAPALANCPGYPVTAHVFAAATGGKVACLDPRSGVVQWSTTVAAGQKAHLSSALRVSVSRTPEGDRRTLIFGAGLGEITGGRAAVYCLEDFVATK